jgi:hypothetical protein
MTPADAAKLVTVALAAYPTPASFLGPEAVEDMTTAWHLVLCDLEYRDAQAALVRYMATCPDKLPGPGHLRRIASEAVTGRARTGLDAWGDVKRAIGSVGRYRQPAFADPLVARCVEAIGWVAICDSEDEMVERAHFVRAYDAMAGKAAEDRSVASLPGVARPALPANDAVPLFGYTPRRLGAGS